MWLIWSCVCVRSPAILMVQTSSLPRPPPPSNPRTRRLVSTHDVDEARLAFGRLYAESTLDPLRGAPFRCTLDVGTLGGVNIVTGSWPGGAHTIVPLLGDRYVFSCSAGGVSNVDCMRERFTISSGRRGALFSPGMGATIQIGPGFEGRTLTIERGELEAHFRALTGHELRGPMKFDTNLVIDAGPGAAIFEIAQTFRRESEQPGASPLLISALRDALFTSLLTNAPHSASALLTPPQRVTPGCVRRAEEYIDAHAAEPRTLADIAAAAGVSVRSLQEAFKSYRGTTPMERLRGRRFELARQRLIAADTGTTVAGVVSTLGLGDAGRFSVLYKKRFGESPSETLARGRRR
ncbi:MAG: AraC family transcriptional regulator [Minicystis sp.]